MLSLQRLERYVKPSMQVLDLGSGTGILSVAIAQLGAQVLAVDNDPIAVAATEEAVRQNQVSDRVTVMQGSLGSGSTLGHWMSGEAIDGVPQIESTSRFDLVMANILGRVHLSLIEEYRRSLRVEGSGWLITAGFTTDYESEITTAFHEVGFELIEVMRSQQHSEQWVAMAHRLK
jgi:ribosomal protein L11 methyltransferase